MVLGYNKFGVIKVKKTIIISILAALFISGISFGLSFTDINSNNWFYDDVMDLTNRGVVNGFDDGTFRPDDSVSVDQFIKLVVTSLGYDFENGEIYWASPFIDKAIELDLIETDMFANYRRPISRGEMAKIIVNALDENYTNEIFEYSFYMCTHNNFPCTLNTLKIHYNGYLSLH